MRLCTETVTFLRQSVDPETGDSRWTAQEARGVSWFNQTAAAIDPTTGLKAADNMIIRIPVESAPGGLEVKAGDQVVKGELPDTEAVETRRKWTVLSVTDNRRARAKHWKVVAA